MCTRCTQHSTVRRSTQPRWLSLVSLHSPPSSLEYACSFRSLAQDSVPPFLRNMLTDNPIQLMERCAESLKVREREHVFASALDAVE